MVPSLVAAFAAMIALAAAPAAAASHYKLTLFPVGPEPGALRNVFGVINDKGVVAGFHADWRRNGKRPADFTAAILDHGRFHPLPTLGGSETVVYAINAEGDVAGTSDLAAGRSHAFLFRDGHMRDLGTLGGNSSIAFALNADDVVVGQSDAADGSAHAFVWRDGRLSDFNDLLPPSPSLLGGENYTLANASAINDAGDVILWARTASGRYAPLMLHLNTLNEIKPPAGWRAIVSAASFKSDGSFTGSFTNAAGIEQGFIYSHGTFREIPALSGSSRAYAANASGLAVGESQARDGRSHAFLWDGAATTDLDTLFDDDARMAAGHVFRLATATAIDAEGRIVGAAWEDGPFPMDAVFVLTPTRGPGVWGWIAIGLAAAAILALATLRFASPARFTTLSQGALALARASVLSITPANAAASLETLGRWLLTIAAVEALALVLLALFGAAPWTMLIDCAVFALSAVFLIRRRSRAVAIFAFGYAAFALMFALILSDGIARALVASVAAIGVLHVSWQAARAADLDRKTRSLKMRWNNVALVGAATLAGFVLPVALLTYAARHAGLNTTNGYVLGLVVSAAILFALFAVMAPLSAKKPFASP